MKITNLKLKNFRNYDMLNLQFSNYKNIIIGDNGVGKTNIVEAIYYLALTKSFRCSDDILLINENADRAIIEANIKTNINNTYRLVLSKAGKKITIDNNPVSRISDYISKLNIILFSIDDLKLIKDNPSVHRKLINMELSQFNNEYLKLLSLHNKLLKQRNTYLKEKFQQNQLSLEYLEVLDEKLIDYGLKIYNIRKGYIDTINLYLPEIFIKSTKKPNLKINYISQYDNKTKEDLIKMYKKNRTRDITYGKTHVGINLDDYIFEISGKEARNYLSEGEQKSAIISFKLAEIKYCIEIFNKVPILILDDLFSELDNKKINSLISNLKKSFQIFITTTDLTKVNKRLLKNCRVIKITKNKMEVKDYEWRY